MTRNTIILLLGLLPLVAGATVPITQYAALEGKTGGQLQTAVKASAMPKSLVKASELASALRQIDFSANGDDEDEGLWSSPYSMKAQTCPADFSGLTAERSVPYAWFGGSDCPAYTDLIHIHPCDSETSGRKGYYPPGIVKTVIFENGMTKVGFPERGGCNGAKWVFEPADVYKGDLAREYFYIFTIYDDAGYWSTNSDYTTFYSPDSHAVMESWAISMLLEWSRLDPISIEEKERNEAVYRLQGNSNPFIDLPLLAEYMWGSLAGRPFDSSNGTAEPLSVPEVAQSSGQCVFYDLQGRPLAPGIRKPGLCLGRDAAGRVRKILVK